MFALQLTVDIASASNLAHSLELFMIFILTGFRMNVATMWQSAINVPPRPVKSLHKEKFYEKQRAAPTGRPAVFHAFVMDRLAIRDQDASARGCAWS